MDLNIIILAAGQGTRMRSDLPKVLHPVGGKPLLEHVITTARQVSACNIHVVYGHGGEKVTQTLAHLNVDWVEQAEQLGTGHAVQQAMPHIPQQGIVLILYGDVPLTKKETLIKLLKAAEGDQFALLTVALEDATGYGRIVRDCEGKVTRIVEHKDASEEEKEIKEINTGILAASAANMHKWLDRIENNNAQGEYYLTDIIALAVEDGLIINTVSPSSEIEVMGINDKLQLSIIEREHQRQQAEQLMRDGVSLLDPGRLDIRGEVSCGKDVSIDVNVILEGKVNIGNGVKIGPNTYIKNTKIDDHVEILANCVIEDAIIGSESRIGPFARIRPETVLSRNTHIGNFVEIKKSDVGEGSKINHLSYVGDTTVGKSVNIGAGTITCNYDGANKHRTIIGDNAFIGSDTQLVAPVKVGKGATIGAGSTITKDTPDNELTYSRVKQESRKGYKRPTK